MATPDQTVTEFKDDDERLLAELGYKQQLNRAWSGFSNFAISFSIISILAGCFTGYAFAWNNGGPVASRMIAKRPNVSVRMCSASPKFTPKTLTP